MALLHSGPPGQTLGAPGEGFAVGCRPAHVLFFIHPAALLHVLVDDFQHDLLQQCQHQRKRGQPCRCHRNAEHLVPDACVR